MVTSQHRKDYQNEWRKKKRAETKAKLKKLEDDKARNAENQRKRRAAKKLEAAAEAVQGTATTTTTMATSASSAITSAFQGVTNAIDDGTLRGTIHFQGTITVNDGQPVLVTINHGQPVVVHGVSSVAAAVSLPAAASTTGNPSSIPVGVSVVNTTDTSGRSATAVGVASAIASAFSVPSAANVPSADKFPSADNVPSAADHIRSG